MSANLETSVRQDAAETEHLPEVPALPFGERLRVFRVFFSDRLALLRRFGEGGRDLVRFRLFSRYIVFVNDPKAVGEVLLERAADYRKGPSLSIYSRPLLGNGLLSSEGDFHRRQ